MLECTQFYFTATKSNLCMPGLHTKFGNATGNCFIAINHFAEDPQKLLLKQLLHN